MTRVAAIVVFLAAGAGTNVQAAVPLDVFVSIPPQKFLVERIGGDTLKVNVLLQPGHSPETFDPAPSQIAKLSDAAAYFRIGVPFEDMWMDVITNRNKGLLVVDCRPQPGPAGDPHTWTDPRLVMQQSGMIVAGLERLLPGSAAIFRDNHLRLLRDLDELDSEISTVLAQRRHNMFIVTHDSWNYFARRYGLEQLSLESFGRQKGPRGLADLVRLARSEGIRTVFIQPQHPAATAVMLARELDAELVELDPLAEAYIDNMRLVGRRVAESLR